MKKLLIVLAVIVSIALILVLIATSFRSPEAVEKSAAQPWPGGLGSLGAVAARFPPVEANEASRKLQTLARALPASEAAGEFVTREMVKGELTIGQPPALADVSAISELLRREPVIWGRSGGVSEIGGEATSQLRGMNMQVARALVASALAKARANDPTSWDDLHAVWRLASALDSQPEMMMQTADLSMVRMINAVAWKMPLPAPSWLDEMHQRDEVGRMLAAFQYQTASYWLSGDELFPTKMLADSVEHDRHIAESLWSETRCEVTVPMNDLGTDLSSVWRRSFRYRAEREATVNALLVRQGKPIAAASRCTDGSWTFDGTTLRFSRDIPTAAPDRPMPLVLRLK